MRRSIRNWWFKRRWNRTETWPEQATIVRKWFPEWANLTDEEIHHLVYVGFPKLAKAAARAGQPAKEFGERLAAAAQAMNEAGVRLAKGGIVPAPGIQTKLAPGERIIRPGDRI